MAWRTSQARGGQRRQIARADSNRNLESLTVGERYKAKFKRLGDKKNIDGSFNPLIGIFHPYHPESQVPGLLVPEGKGKSTPLSREIWDIVVEQGEGCGFFNVTIIDNLKSHRYVAIANEFEIESEQASHVVKGTNVFYARYVSQRRDINDDPIMKFYVFDDGRPKGSKGYLRAEDDQVDYDRKTGVISRREITRSIIKGSDEVKPLMLGDYLLVRRVGKPRGSLCRVEPVVNFKEEDDVSSPDGTSLVTKVDGSGGSMVIKDLPILFSCRGMLGTPVGVGFIPSKDEGYQRVEVIGAADAIKKYVTCYQDGRPGGVITARLQNNS